MRTLQREAGFRRCLILYGNVRDLWPTSNGNQQRLTELIGSALSDDFTLQGTWDSIDGLRFESQSQLTNFTDIMELSAPSEDGDEYDLGDNILNEQIEEEGCAHAPAVYRDPTIAFDAMRHVLTAPGSHRPLFIVDWGEHLLTTANQQDLDERGHPTKLLKAISEQPLSQLRGSALDNPTGLLVIITPTLERFHPDFTIMTIELG